MTTTPAPADVNLNALWSRLIAEELARAGVRTAVLCPGSRNSPLLFALAAQSEIRCISHTDERSAGFIALGIAKAGGGPAAVCVTSGSALANLLPAITEAHAAHLPFIVVAADRPWEMHDNGSSQSMPQRGIFAQFLAAELDLGEPTATPAALRALRAQVSRIAQRRGGPVMINVPLRDPLPPLPDPAWKIPEFPTDVLLGRPCPINRPPRFLPFTTMLSAARLGSDGWSLPNALEWLRPGMAGIVITGPADDEYSVKVQNLAMNCGFPLIADVPGGLRGINREAPAAVIACADALVGGTLGQSRPELIIQVGAAPLSRAVYEWLGRQECPWLAIEYGRNQDMLGRAWAAIDQPLASVFPALWRHLGKGDPVWLERWRAADQRARAELESTMAVEPWGEVLAAHLACNHTGFAFRHLASSMSVRHANLHGLPGPAMHHIFANRGVSGIDGTIGTFIGEALAKRETITNDAAMLICGDLAFLHDLPALAAVKAHGLRGAIVVLNNDGGAIFDYLAVSGVDGYRDWVRTPHGADLAHAAAQAGLDYTAVSDRAAMSAALDAAAGVHQRAKNLIIIECKVAGGDTPSRHRALLKAMANAADTATQT